MSSCCPSGVSVSDDQRMTVCSKNLAAIRTSASLKLSLRLNSCDEAYMGKVSWNDALQHNVPQFLRSTRNHCRWLRGGFPFSS